jgi:hypothetical protein
MESHLKDVLCRGYDGRMRPHVIILGCGFGGLFAARALRGEPQLAEARRAAATAQIPINPPLKFR